MTSRLRLALLTAFARPALVIDCAELLHASSDMRLIDSLASQTGYWPVFTFLNSMNNLIDLASTGLIGQKGPSLSFRPLYRPHHVPSRNELLPPRASQADT